VYSYMHIDPKNKQTYDIVSVYKRDESFMHT
jgi:hypothetical protein